MSKPKIIKASELKSTDWSGGKTTELFIYPQNSSLQSLNFEFRLSKAEIEQEETYFSKLPGMYRSLVLLEGKLALSHNENKPRNIELYDHDFFHGDSQTKSLNKAVVFNVVSKEKLRFIPTAVSVLKGCEFKMRNFEDYEFVYVHKGKLNSDFGELNQGDILIVDEKQLFSISTLENSLLVHFSINLQA